jgi:hypothetical protein
MNVLMKIRRFAEKNGWNGFAEIALPGVDLIKGSISNSNSGGVYFNCSNSSKREKDGKDVYYTNVKLSQPVQTACDQVLNLAYTRCNEVAFNVDDDTGRVTIDKDSIKVGAASPTLIENADVLAGMAQAAAPEPKQEAAAKEQVSGESSIDEAFN